MNKKEKLEIPFDSTASFGDIYGMIVIKCRDIIAYLTSEVYGLDGNYKEKAIKLALACEEFIK